MDYAAVITIIPSILGLVTKIIDTVNSDRKQFHKKFKGTGVNEKLLELEKKLTEIQAFRNALLFYARLLPETASVYTLSDKLNEMIHASKHYLHETTSPHHDSSWASISMMYNSVKGHKNSQLVSRMDNCPLDPTSAEIRDIAGRLRELDAEFGRADAYMTSRQSDNLLDVTQRISQIASDLKVLALRQTEGLINSLST